MMEHKWIVDYEPVADTPVPAGSGDPTPKHEAAPVGENRSGIAVVITNGVRRVEVRRIAFAPGLRKRSRLEAKLLEAEEEVAQPACDKLNNAQARIVAAKREAEEALRITREAHAQRLAVATSELRRVESEVLHPWSGELT